jgi:membrane-bound lytic murein transglycosylase A
MKKILLCGRLLLSCILGALAACVSSPVVLPDMKLPDVAPPGVAQPDVAQPQVGASAPASVASAPVTTISIALQSRIAATTAQWLPVDWAELVAWEQDDLRQLWPALRRSCQRPEPAWRVVCREVLATTAVPQSAALARQWLQTRLKPYRVQATDGNAHGLITGYFEPQMTAKRQPDAVFRYAVYAPPADLASRKPYWSRQDMQRVPQAQAALRGHELAYLSDPLDVLSLQIQGSGRVRFIDSGRSAPLQIRLAFAAHNGHAYQSIGRWLMAQGELHAAQANWPAMRAWGQLNPERVDDMLASNPRVVFFREEALPDPELGPKGAQAVPLTPGRSIAVDPQSIPLGSVVWLDTTEPSSQTPLQKAVMAQDIGGAIKGAVRADYFWGWGDEALHQAGRMKQDLRLWVLWPVGYAPKNP